MQKSRALAALLATSFLVRPALAQDFSASGVPALRINGTSDSKFTYFTVLKGDPQNVFTYFPSQLGYIAQGTAINPVTTDGPTFSIYRYESLDKPNCPDLIHTSGNFNNTECSTALNVINIGSAVDPQVVSAINASVVTNSTVNNGNGQAINAHAYARGVGNINVASGAYIVGRRDVDTAQAHGAEISGWNYTNSTAAVNYNKIGDVDGIWLAARGITTSFPESSALHIARVSTTGIWQEGVTINTLSVTGVGFNDQSDSTKAFLAASNHDIILDATGATIGSYFIRSPNASIDANGRVAAGLNRAVSNGGTGAGLINTYSFDTGNNEAQAKYTADGTAVDIRYYKTRATAIGSNGALTTGDQIAQITAFGDDGAAGQIAARETVTVANTVSAGVVPGRYDWALSNNAGVLTQSLRMTATSLSIGASFRQIADNAGNLFGQALSVGPLTALTAGGDATHKISFTSGTAPAIFVGSGVPTISAPQGSLYLRSEGSSGSTRAYINTDGATTWTAVTTAS